MGSRVLRLQHKHTAQKWNRCLRVMHVLHLRCALQSREIVRRNLQRMLVGVEGCVPAVCMLQSHSSQRPQAGIIGLRGQKLTATIQSLTVPACFKRLNHGRQTTAMVLLSASFRSNQESRSAEQQHPTDHSLCRPEQMPDSRTSPMRVCESRRVRHCMTGVRVLRSA